MKPQRLLRNLILLFVGDAVCLALITLAGLSTHEELGAWTVRLWPTFLPLLAAWLLTAPHFQLFDPATAADPRSLWRPVWAMLLAAPLGILLRSLWLGMATTVVVFTLILGGLSALVLLAWRGLWVVLAQKYLALQYG